MKERGSSILEILFIILMFSCWIVPPLLFKKWWWFGFFVLVGVTFGIIELIAKLVTGRTLSQQFWYWSIAEDANGKKYNLKKAVIWVCCMLAGWVMLLLHLSEKMIFGG